MQARLVKSCAPSMAIIFMLMTQLHLVILSQTRDIPQLLRVILALMLQAHMPPLKSSIRSRCAIDSSLVIH